jgi:hypothetical protein
VSAPSTREAALAALLQLLEGLAGPTVLRNEVLPETVPAGGLVILRDGDLGAPLDVTLNPVSYLWEHRAELEVLVQGATPAARDAALGALLLAIAAALAADPTLGGLVDRAAPDAPELSHLAIDGAPGLKGARVPVALTYVTGSALG